MFKVDPVGSPFSGWEDLFFFAIFDLGHAISEQGTFIKTGLPVGVLLHSFAVSSANLITIFEKDHHHHCHNDNNNNNNRNGNKNNATHDPSIRFGRVCLLCSN